MNKMVPTKTSLQNNLIIANMKSLDHEAFVRNYKEYLIRDLADGHPSEDTKNTYFSNIDNFLHWCDEYDLPPLYLQEYHLKVYREYLWQHGYKIATVALKLTALRQFYQCATRLKLIEENPMQDVRPGKNPNASLPSNQYLTAGQLEYLLRIIPVEDEGGCYHEEHYRDRLMIAIMGLEGLRTVEINRLNVKDIYWHNNTILIRGKGHNDLIYPHPDIVDMLKHYLDNKKLPPIDDADGTPVFTVVSNHNTSCRMSRRAIREAVDYWFAQAGIKQKGDKSGLSCHLLRHTCGTLLYAETRDLQVVKETLRHRDLKMASKYAHLQNRHLNRHTNSIPVKIV